MHRYLSHLLGHEADGSILAALKERNLADSLSSYTGENFDAFSVMSLHIELTQEGLENVEDVVSCVYAYIGMLQRTHTKEKLPEIAWIAEELGIVRDFMFRFKSFSAPSSQVVSLANDMQEYVIVIRWGGGSAPFSLLYWITGLLDIPDYWVSDIFRLPTRPGVGKDIT